VVQRLAARTPLLLIVEDGGDDQADHAQTAPDQAGALDRQREHRDQRGDRPDHGNTALQLVQGQHGRGLLAVGHADQRGFGGVGDKAHRHKDATADGDGDGQGFYFGILSGRGHRPAPPVLRDQGPLPQSSGAGFVRGIVKSCGLQVLA
jgi:hypothetical protein